MPRILLVWNSLPTIPSYVLGSKKVEALDTNLATKEEIFSLLQDNLRWARQRMEQQANYHRTNFEFDEGDGSI